MKKRIGTRILAVIVMTALILGSISLMTTGEINAESVTEKIKCPQCHGTKTIPQKCNRCNGGGHITCSVCGGNGKTSNSSNCSKCKGKGKIPNIKTGNIDACTKCGGSGKIFSSVTCQSCGGNRTLVCTGCGGNGKVNERCAKCNGTGSIEEVIRLKKLCIVSTGSKNVKSGQKRTIKIKGTNAEKAKWSVSGTGKMYIRLNNKKGAQVSFTVKENAVGKAKVTAKLAANNKVSYTYKLSCDAVAISLEGKEVQVGVTSKLKLSIAPSNAILSNGVVYGVFSDEEAYTFSTDAVVTASDEGCFFYTEKSGTYYVEARVGDMLGGDMFSIAKVTAISEDYATAIELEGKDVYTGEFSELALVTVPYKSRLIYDVVYEVFSDEFSDEIATDAVVTAGDRGCFFYTEKAGRYYVKATAGEMCCIAKIDAVDRN